MSLTTIIDFGTYIKSVLDAGTFTNYKSLNQNREPNILIDGKGDPNVGTKRGNKNSFIDLRNLASPPPELAFDGTVIIQNLNGTIVCSDTNNDNRNAMKADVINIIKAEGIPYSSYIIDDNPNKRNKNEAFLTIQIIKC